MMTKEEFIENAIEYRKRGIEHVHSHMCNKFANCKTCPISNRGSRGCLDAYIDEIIRLREEKTEKVETNLEHYYYAYDYLSTTQNLDDVYERITVEFKKGAYDSYTKSNVGIIDWLLAPYEPSKRYQMSQFEYDLIKTYRENHYSSWAIEDLVMLRYMESLGYFKNIPKDTRIRDILENAEVVEE